jgi:hypothetical protein
LSMYLSMLFESVVSSAGLMEDTFVVDGWYVSLSEFSELELGEAPFLLRCPVEVDGSSV